VLPPPRMPVANEGAWETPSKNGIPLVITVTARGQ